MNRVTSKIKYPWIALVINLFVLALAVGVLIGGIVLWGTICGTFWAELFDNLMG